jgi:hypothetical protein
MACEPVLTTKQEMRSQQDRKLHLAEIGFRDQSQLTG